MIKRKRGAYQGRNKSSAYKDLIWAVATSSDTSLNIKGQTKLALATIEENLKELGSDKTHIVSTQIYIANMQDKEKMDTVWNQWIGSDPKNWPQRAYLGVALERKTLILLSWLSKSLLLLLHLDCYFNIFLMRLPYPQSQNN